MINNQNYIVIQGFMINELGLKGNNLLVYAIIYGFSQTKGQKYTGGLKYLMEWINTNSKQTVINCLNNLIERNLIEKEEKYINNVKFCSYGVVQKIDHYTKKHSKGGPKIGPNNIYIKEEEEREIEIKNYETENPFTFYENNFGLMSSYIAENINTYIADGLTEDLILETMKNAVDNNAKTWGYVKKILNDCIEKNITTVEQYKAAQIEFRKRKTNKTTQTTTQKEVKYNTDFSEYDKYANRNE